MQTEVRAPVGSGCARLCLLRVKPKTADQAPLSPLRLRADSSKSVVHDDGRRKGPGPEALEAGVFALRSLEDGSADSRVRAFLASDQVRADKAVRAPVSSFLESALALASPACQGIFFCCQNLETDI